MAPRLALGPKVMLLLLLVLVVYSRGELRRAKRRNATLETPAKEARRKGMAGQTKLPTRCRHVLALATAPESNLLLRGVLREAERSAHCLTIHYTFFLRSAFIRVGWLVWDGNGGGGGCQEAGAMLV